MTPRPTPTYRERQAVIDASLRRQKTGGLLSAQHDQFVAQFLIDLDPHAAARRAGLPPETGPKLLAIPTVQREIARAKALRVNRLQLEQDFAFRSWVLLRDADVNEIVEARRVNCRHCHGRGYEEQRNDIEYRVALRLHEAALDKYDRLSEEEREVRSAPVFEELGGPGFRKNAPPNPDCPVCDGDGVLSVIIKDTRNLSPGGKLLYNGVKVGAGGAIEIKVRDRDHAADMIAKHIGMFPQERRWIDDFDPERLSDAQLDAVLTTMVERGVIELEAEGTEIDNSDVSDAEFEEGES